MNDLKRIILKCVANDCTGCPYGERDADNCANILMMDIYLIFIGERPEVLKNER